MSKPRVDYTSERISKETVIEVAEENYVAGLKEGERRERRALLKIMPGCYEWHNAGGYWFFNNELFHDRLKTLDAKRAKRLEGK